MCETKEVRVGHKTYQVRFAHGEISSIRVKISRANSHFHQWRRLNIGSKIYNQVLEAYHAQ